MATVPRTIITTMPTSPPGPSIPPIILSPPSSTSGPTSSFDLNDKHKRWVVTGIALNRLLLPVLRDFAGKELSKHYATLKSSFGIDTQVPPTHMQKDGSFNLNYGSINNNFKKSLGRYDYKVSSAEDLAKLYLKPFMAKFTGFDNTCDLSAVLGMLENASVFNTPTNIQNNAKVVRSKVRNEWGHCNFDHWNDLDFNHCFQLMETLIRSLGLPTANEKQLLDDLQDWHTRGLQLCMGCPVDKDLMKLVSIEVTNLAQNLEAIKKSNAEEANKISEALKDVKHEINVFDRRITELETRMDNELRAQSEKNKFFSEAIGDISNSVPKIEKRQDTTEQKVSQLEERHNQLESTVETLDCRLKKLEEGYMKATANAEIFQLPRRNSCFCGRESELQTITELLNNTENGCSESAICGLGGVGKTSLAVEFLWRQKDKKEYPGGIFWISGENNNLFQLSVSEMARQVGTFDDEDFSNSLLRTLDWLRKRKHLWCLVVDNLDELEMSMDMRNLLIGHWKQAARGHIIITTRREAKEIGEETGIKERSCIVLKCLTDKEGVQFLRVRSEITGEDDDFRELVQELGGLPLALDQAAAYIRCVPHSTVKEYVIKYKEKRLLLLDKKKARHLVENTSRERLAVTTTWLLNFDHIRRISKEEDFGEIPALVMHISAYLGPDDIPFEVINEELNRVENTEAAGDVWDSGDIVSLLTRFSLFQGYRTKSFSVHRLVQEVMRSEIKREQTEFRVLSCAVRVLHHALATTRSPAEVCRSFSESAVFRVENPPSLRLWGKLASHATYLQEHLCSFSKKHRGEAEGLLHTEEAVRLLNDAGIFFSVSQEKVKAQEMQGMKLEMLVNLERSTVEEAPDDLPHYFIDAPLKHRNYKVISCCMRQPLFEKETLADQDSRKIGKGEEANKLRENGNVAIESKKYEEASNLYSKAIDLSPGDYRLFFNRALCHLKLNKPESALDDCGRCLSLNPNNSKALHRKAWALRELVKSGQSQRIGQERAAVALALHFDPSLKQDKQFCEIFPKVQEIRIREISNETQLAFALMTTQDNETWLLREGQYSVTEFIVLSDLQIVGLGSKTILNCTELCFVSQASLYVESIVFQKGSSSLACVGKEGAIHTIKCVFSGGLASCEDYPECNGGPGCKMSSSGKTACDRAGKFGNSDTKSGIVGAPGVMILAGSSALLEDCEICNCGGGGALVAGKGSRLFVRTCEVYKNRQAGLEARECGELVASRNEIFDGNHHGILIGPDAGECEIRDNAIFENSKEGIYAERNKATVIIQGNDIHHNGPFGISLDNNSKILICNNNIFENGFWGILAKSRTSGCIKGNSLSGNKCGGILIGVNYSGRIYLESNVVRDHAGPWLEYQNTKFILQPSGGMAKDLPAGEKEFYSVRPILSGNEECNNEEGMYHPREVLERPYGGCTYCHRSRDAVHHPRKCPSCHIASYCSKECQRKHRSKHKTLCLALKSRYSVTVELIPYEPETLGSSVLCMRTFGSHLKGIGEGPKLKRDSYDKFIVKVQTGTLNTHPLQKLIVYDQSLSIDGFIQSPDIFNVIWECGVLGALHKFTSKKVFFWAMFAEGGKKLTIFLDHLAPYQEW